MKKIAQELRILKTDEQKHIVLCRLTACVYADKAGVYEHLGKMYKYLITDYNVDYFVQIVEPLDIGLKVI